MLLLRILCFSALHFGLWFAAALVAHGPDLDQVPAHSGLASAAASVCAVLQYPHDLLLRALPVHLLQQVPEGALALVATNSVLWGTVLFVAWRLLPAMRRNAGIPESPAQ
jgi:hypothetical protein